MFSWERNKTKEKKEEETIAYFMFMPYIFSFSLNRYVFEGSLMNFYLKTEIIKFFPNLH